MGTCTSKLEDDYESVAVRWQMEDTKLVRRLHEQWKTMDAPMEQMSLQVEHMSPERLRERFKQLGSKHVHVKGNASWRWCAGTIEDRLTSVCGVEQLLYDRLIDALIRPGSDDPVFSPEVVGIHFFVGDLDSPFISLTKRVPPKTLSKMRHACIYIGVHELELRFYHDQKPVEGASEWYRNVLKYIGVTSGSVAMCHSIAHILHWQIPDNAHKNGNLSIHVQ
jgi:hypothetical protein